MDTATIIDQNLSVYAVDFTQSVQRNHANERFNLMFIGTQQRALNDMLQMRGHVFLNEVYDALGLPRTRRGVLVGWLRDETPYIEFSIKEVGDSLIIDFNDPTPIHDKI